MRDGDVLLVSDYAGDGGSATGGAGIAVMNSFLALQSASVRVSLVSGLDFPSGTPSDPALTTLGGFDLRAGSSVGGLKTIYNTTSRRALAAVLKNHDPDRTVVILHQWTRYLTPSAIALLRPFPLMIYMHDYFWACPTGNYFDFRRGEPCVLIPGSVACCSAQCDRAGYAHKLARLARHAALSAAKRGSRRERVVLHISRRARAVVEPLLPGYRHAIVYNPLELPPANEPSLAEPPFQVGYFGRLEPEKGIRPLLEALQALNMTGLFVGEGGMAETIASTPGMTLAGWQPKQAVMAMMRQCSIIVLPSLWPETWGLITAEAMALGVPVLVSRRAGSSELVDKFGGGIVFDPADKDALRICLGRLARELLPGLSSSAQMDLAELLSAQRHASDIARLARDTWRIDVGIDGMYVRN